MIRDLNKNLVYVVTHNLSQLNLLFNKSKQIAAYADDVNLMGRSVRDITELYLVLEENAKTIGPVSYTHLDVYKRQHFNRMDGC